MTTFSASLTNITVLLPQSHDRNCYLSTRILAPPQLTAETHRTTHTRLHPLSRLVTSASAH